MFLGELAYSKQLKGAAAISEASLAISLSVQARWPWLACLTKTEQSAKAESQLIARARRRHPR